ncbi:hypothetical protein [Streptomyces sp. NPDC088254]|uniref:hypothetical protein n=1 Tax=Streptomyces sp. NPDC088254 TaxID=3365847 RepID=UPI003802B208
MRSGPRRTTARPTATTAAGATATAALLLGSLTPTIAQAAPAAASAAPAHADVRTTLRPEPTSVAPGRVFHLHLVTDLVTGAVPKLAVTLTLPAGLTYARPTDPDNLQYRRCLPSADGRTVTCRSLDAPHEHVWEQLGIRVGKDVNPGAALTVTATTDIGDAIDDKPEDNTATATVRAVTGTDVGVSWQPPTVPARPGRPVVTKLVVTNHGPGSATAGQAVKLHIDSTAFRTWPSAPRSCWADPDVLVCETPSELAAGESHTFELRWTFPKESGGKKFRVPTTLSHDALDPCLDNDRAELVLDVAKTPPPGPKPPKPTPTPTSTAGPKPTPTPTASPSGPGATASPAPATGGGSGVTPQSGGGHLAATGAGPMPVLAAGAAVLVLAGGALLAVRARMRRDERDSR